jgi:hypothetical protein
MIEARAPLNISYETDNCFVRELEVSDELELLCGWMSDANIARGLNAPVGKLTIEDARKYVFSHDRIKSHALGVFSKATGKFQGLWAVYIDWERKEFLVNVLLAEKFESEVGGVEETGRPIYALLFDEHGMETLSFNVLASNDKVRKRIKREPERVTRTASPDGSGSDAIHHFRITREQYYELRSRRAERDEQFRRKRGELRQQRS